MMRPRTPRIFRILVRLLPSRFRSQFGAEVLAVLNAGYEAACRRGTWPRLLFIGLACANLITSAIKERLNPSSGKDVMAPTGRRFFSGAYARDFRTAVRTMRLHGSFTAIVVLTLALGIGANSAVFSVLESVVLKRLPYGSPEQLVRLNLFIPEHREPDRRLREYFSEPLIHELQQLDEIFSGVAAMSTYRNEGADVSLGNRPVRMAVFQVSVQYFDVLGVRPVVGAMFRDDDQGTPVAILNHSVWSEFFGEDPDVVGRTVLLDGVAHRVAGVMPRGFQNPLGYAADIWTSIDLRPHPSWQRNWENHYLGSIARLAPGVSIEAAQQRLDIFSSALTERTPVSYEMGARVSSLHDATVASVRPMLWMLMGAVGLLLLTASVNVANLFYVHSAARSQQFAMRVALGAARSDIVRQLVIEGLFIAALGGLVGLGFAFSGLKVLVMLSPDNLPRTGEISIDTGVLLFTTVVAVGTGVAFGLTPAWRLLRSDLTQELRSGTRSSVGVERSRFHAALIVFQVATSIVLLIGAGLITTSFVALRKVDLGVEPDGALLFEVHLPESRYTEPADRIAFNNALYERIRGMPDVTAVGSVDWLPAHGRYHPWGFQRLDLPEQFDGDPRGVADARVVAGEYFQAARLTILRGRSFGTADGPDVPKVAVVSQTVAEQSFAGEEVLGKRIRLLGRTWEIVGVVEDVPSDPQGSVVPSVYLPHDQFADNRNWQLLHVISTPRDPTALVPRLHELLRGLDPELVLHRARPLDDAFVDVVAQERFTAFLMVLFASIAFTLAIVGVYGIVAYAANNRVKEIGIRLALGAKQSHVRRLVTQHAMSLTAVGILLGLVAGLGLTRWLQSLNLSIVAADPTLFVLVVAAFGITAWIAGMLPARRAARTEPVTVLRDERIGGS